ncbi:MAG: type II 3-dehydroquinate dehydratase, partial [Verrucomicrobiota bacterium]
MKNIVIINGPNLDRLGLREPSIYGDQTLTDLENILSAEAEALGVNVLFYQSNHEGFIIDEINNEIADSDVFGMIINPGA